MSTGASLYEFKSCFLEAEGERESNKLLCYIFLKLLSLMESLWDEKPRKRLRREKEKEKDEDNGMNVILHFDQLQVQCNFSFFVCLFVWCVLWIEWIKLIYACTVSMITINVTDWQRERINLDLVSDLTACEKQVHFDVDVFARARKWVQWKEKR